MLINAVSQQYVVSFITLLLQIPNIDINYQDPKQVLWTNLIWLDFLY